MARWGRKGGVWLVRRTLEARAEGSLAVPNNSVALARSTSFTFW